MAIDPTFTKEELEALLWACAIALANPDCEPLQGNLEVAMGKITEALTARQANDPYDAERGLADYEEKD